MDLSQYELFSPTLRDTKSATLEQVAILDVKVSFGVL